MKKYTTRKYNGDDRYSWAVFLARDVRGTRGPVALGYAQPVVSGLTQDQARWYRNRIEELRG